MNIDQQVTYLMQGTEYGDETLRSTMEKELRERLLLAEKEGRKLRVYCGFDPRTSDLHLGHTVVMHKMRQFQALGHDVIFLVGNYTSLIGDPSDKDKLRPQLTAEEVAHNAQTYAEQAFKIMDRERTQIRYNAEWLSKLTFAELIKLASNFTVQQFLTRENFRKRFDNGDPIYLHETFYAIMQGYDAYALDCDVQVGGTDQLFNIVTAARKIMTYLGKKPNIAIILDILPGTDGEIKMSKSLGNHIPILSTPEDMYGKVMSLPDKAMPQFFRLLTRWSPEEVKNMEADLSTGRVHPRDIKMRLAREIVSVNQGEDQVERAEAHFVQVFQKGSLPDDIPPYPLKEGETILDVLTSAGLVASNSEARRLMQQNGIRFNGEVITNLNVPFPGPGVLQVGKRKFLRLT